MRNSVYLPRSTTAVKLNTRSVSSCSPHQLIKTRTPVPAGQPPKATLREDRLPGTTASWKEYQQGKVVEGWRESCGAVFETPFDER